jgi:hypothetical protein
VVTEEATSERLRIGSALLASALMAFPLWVGRFLPLLDLPQHLAITTVLLHHADPAWQLAPYFEPQRGELTPYWAHYLALEALGRVMSVNLAARVFLTLYVVALPWAAMALARALGRPALAGLFAIPLALNGNLYYGFIAYCWSIVVLLWAMALLARQLDQPTARRATGLAVLAAVLFFSHVQSFAFLLLSAGVLSLIGKEAFWTRARRAWPLLPATLGIFLPWLYLSTTDRPGAERYFPPLDDPHATYGDPVSRFTGLADAVAGSFQDGSDGWLLAAWAIAVAGALVATRREGDAAARRPVIALAAAALACYFVLPVSIQGQWNISQRFAWTVALLVPLLVGRASRWIPPVVVVLSAATAANAGWHHFRFDREVGPFNRALAAIPPGSRVLGFMYDNRGQVLERWPYLHFEQYAVVRGGGVAAHSFTANAPLPVRLRPEARVAAPNVWNPGEFRYDRHRDFFDYFLVRVPAAKNEGPSILGTKEVFRGGAWRVYKVYRDFSNLQGMNRG